MSSGAARSQTLAIGLALIALYLIWGSTYLAIRWTLEGFPPFGMAGVRFLIAGSALIVAARLSGEQWPRGVEWRNAAVVGAALFVGGNGGVVWAETRVSSGVAALLIALVPLWVAVLEWALYQQRPGPVRSAGVAVGLVGLWVLVGREAGGQRMDGLGALALVGSAFSWAFGSLYAKHSEQPASATMSAGVQMLWGGVFLSVLAVLSRETVDLATVSARVWWSWWWLLVGGSIVGFTLYSWLLRTTRPAVATTYAYVNPVVAVVLGWAFAGETLSGRVFLSGALILVAVSAIQLAPVERRAAA